MRRFETAAATVAAAVLLLTLGVLMRGDRTAYEPVSVEPAAGARDVSTRAPITIHFGRDLDGRSVAGHVRLQPPAEGTLTASGSTLRWYPGPGLAPETEYTVVVEPGLRSTSGWIGTAEHRLTFRTRAARLLVARDEGDGVQLTLATPEGHEQAITRLEPTARDFALSPEGDRLAYIASDRPVLGNDSLWILDLATGDRRSVEGRELVALARPDWSPDGRRLAYERRGGRDDPAEPRDGQSGDGRAELAPPPRQIWLAEADGRSLGAIYGGAGKAGYMPIWSPVGERLAFFEPNLRALAILDGGATGTTLPWGGGLLAGWSPDGTRLLVTEGQETAADLARTVVRVLDGVGDAARDLTPPEASDRMPAWSPDRSVIALVRSDRTGSGVWVADPDGQAARPVATGRPWEYLKPSWSADGRRLAFVRVPRQGAGTAPEVWVAEPDGEPRLVAHGYLIAWVP